MEKLTKEFIKENILILLQEDLNEQLILHLITLFDAQQIEKEQLVEIIGFYNIERENFFSK